MEVHSKKQNKKRKFHARKRKNKLVLVFDEDARREFLTGFHKRKVERRNRAKENLEKQLKLERKRIKAEAKEAYKNMLLSQKPIPEIENLLSKEIDMGTHCVKITELSTAELAKKNNWIGINEVQYEGNDSEAESTINNESKCNKENFQIEGMEINDKSKRKLNGGNEDIKTHKDIKKLIKKKATLAVKNSKIFKKKARIEKIKNIKQKKRQEKKQEKILRKNKRLKCKNIKN